MSKLSSFGKNTANILSDNKYEGLNLQSDQLNNNIKLKLNLDSNIK